MLYIMRHGKTDWNIQHKLQGHTDIPLNEEGRQMAKQARKDYLNIPIDICYCSPLIRARETAELVLQGRNIPILCDDRLIEMGFGIYEGTANCEDIPDCPVGMLFRHPEQYIARDGAESMQELWERTGQFLSKIVYPQLKEGKNILIVGHGAMNSSILCQVRHIPLQDFWKAGIPNCKLIKLC